jgi:type I restriction enzyme S subunit
VERIQNLWLVLPPRSEQDAVAAFLERACTRPNAAIDHAHREIALMREYRARLIADVVTGKVDVRAAAQSLPEEEEATPQEAEVEEVEESVANDHVNSGEIEKGETHG